MLSQHWCPQPLPAIRGQATHPGSAHLPQGCCLLNRSAPRNVQAALEDVSGPRRGSEGHHHLYGRAEVYTLTTGVTRPR